MILLVMGVAGAGKTTIGMALAKKLGWVFLDADDFHPAANREKMRQGIHLTDAERIPWLDAMHRELVRLEAEGKSSVLACSALKEEYRERLVGELPVRLVFLKGSPELIRERLTERHGHFAGTGILEDQFATLEEPKDAIVVDVTKTPDELVKEILRELPGQAKLG